MTKKRLTQNQTRRIQLNQQEEASTYGTPKKGLVISHYGKNVDILADDQKIINCNLRQNLTSIAAGDEVIFESTTESENSAGIITKILPRRSLLTRNNPNMDRAKPIAANLDQIFVVFAVEPKPQSYLIDQFLIMAEINQLNAILVLNKYDLYNQLPIEEQQELSELLTIYQNIGYEVLHTSSLQRHSNHLNELLNGKSSIFLGQSGVGKSTITQELLPHLEVATGAISSKSQLGRHTTTVAKLYTIPHLDPSSKLIDAPGVREMGVAHLTRQEIEQAYVEFRPLLGKCKFNDCEHNKEPECALKTALAEGKISQERWHNYKKFVQS